MDNDGRSEQAKHDGDKPSVSRFRPYHSLLNLSQNLGRAATRARTSAKDLLQAQLPSAAASHMFGHGESTSIRKSSEELGVMVTRSHEVLAKARTVFPLTIFPDDVILDRSKVTIIMRKFFWVENVVSVRVEDILNVAVGVGPFFGSLNISSRVMNSIDHFSINFLWRSDALHLKRMIQGYVIARHDNIDIAHLSKEELCNMLDELGSDR